MSIRCFPCRDLPYDSVDIATRLMVKMFETVPFLALLPRISKKDSLLNITLGNVPGVHLREKVSLKETSEAFKESMLHLDIAYNTPELSKLSRFKFNSVFLERYMQIITRIKPKETVVNLLGPFSASQLIKNSEKTQLLLDKNYRKFIVQLLSVRALWISKKIQEASPSTCPIIVFEEPILNKFSDIKREYEEITRETLINMYSKIAQKLNENSVKTAVKCFEKCDWSIPIEAGVDIISFNAYENPNNLNIISEQVNAFLCNGGRIDWGIVPLKNENYIKSLNVDLVYNRFIKTIEDFIDSGVSEKLAYNRSSVSIVSDNMCQLPLLVSEKAIILSTQLAKKIPVKK